MLRKQHVHVLLSLLVVANQAVSSSEKFERFNYQRLVAKPELVSQANSWQAQPQQSPPPPAGRATSFGGFNDKIDHQVASHIHAPRVSLIKPANNQIQANSFHQPSLVDGGGPHQVSGSNGVPAVTVSATRGFREYSESANEPNDARNHQRHHHHQQQLPARGSGGSGGSPVNHHTAPPSLNRHPIEQDSAVINNEASLNGPPSNLELALRQVSGDESVFQPSPTIVAVGHSSNFDWFTQAPIVRQQPNQIHQTGGPASARQMAHLNESEQARNEHNEIKTSASLAPATTTAQELANNNATNHLEPMILDHQQSSTSPHDYYHEQQREQQAREQPQPAGFLTGNSSSSPIEFNNQVIYEGPVTPPASKDDYYFSTSERLPISSSGNNNNINRNNNNYYNEHANTNAWW